jgi:hypothetical protein
MNYDANFKSANLISAYDNLFAQDDMTDVLLGVPRNIR